MRKGRVEGMAGEKTWKSSSSVVEVTGESLPCVRFCFSSLSFNDVEGQFRPEVLVGWGDVWWILVLLSLVDENNETVIRVEKVSFEPN